MQFSSAPDIYTEELALDPRRWVLSFRSSIFRDLEPSGCLRGASAAWMMWPGYLEGASGKQTRATFDRLGIDLNVIHASGHASVGDLQRLAAAIKADRVVPIHTAAPECFEKLFENVDEHPDCEWWEV
jgi:ribonuclease J